MSVKDETTNELPSIDLLAACFELQFAGPPRFLVDARISDHFDSECPECSKPASKVKLKTGKTAYMHSVLIRDGVAVLADYHHGTSRRVFL